MFHNFSTTGKILSGLLLVLLIVGIIFIMAPLKQPQPKTTPDVTMNDRNSLAIEKAKEVFAEHHPDLTQYEISVVTKANSLVVIFLDKTKTSNTIGNPGVLPGFEVELDAQDLRVLNSHFVR